MQERDADAEAGHQQTQQLTPAMFTVEGATEHSGLTRWRIYELIGQGVLEARKAGRRTLVVGDSLRNYLNTLPRAHIRMGKKAA